MVGLALDLPGRAEDRPFPRRMPGGGDDAHRIRELCDAAYNNTMAMRLRMMADYDLYRLAPFTWRQIVADMIPPNMATVTGNDPRTLADTIISLLVEARLVARSPTADQPQPVRDAGRMAERLFHGLLMQAEQQQGGMVQSSVRQQLAFYMCVRGFAAGLHTLTKNRAGETMIHVEIWDPLNVYWGVSSDDAGSGSDHNGLAWACHYQDLDAWRLDARFAGAEGAISGHVKPTYVRENRPMYRVYDFYDRVWNIVVVDGKVVLRQQHFGEGHVPVSIIPVGPSPFIIDPQSAMSYPEEFGASVFAPNRTLYPKLNAVNSVKYERILRQANPPVKVISQTGRKTLPPNISNPFDRGQRYQLAAQFQEDIVPLVEAPIPRDALEFEAGLQMQLQKGGVPNVVHGQNAQPSSGYNTALLISQQRHVIAPRLEAQTQWFSGFEQFVRRQFGSGYFESMHLEGEIDRRTPYSLVAEPATIRQAPRVLIESRIKNQAELAQRVAAAQALIGLGLADRNYVRDEIMEIDDPDAMEGRLALEMAKMLLPETKLWEAMQAAIKDGDQIMAQLIFGNLLKVMAGPANDPQGPGEPRGGGPSSGPPQQRQARPGQPAQGSPGGAGMREGERPNTNAGGSPQAGRPNPSNESQTMGRPRPPGTR